MLTKLVRCFFHFSHFEWGDLKNPGVLGLQTPAGGCNSQIPAHFTRVAALERENWLAQLQEQGQFGQNQFSQFSELTRSIYARSEPTGQFWQMVSALSIFTWLGDWQLAGGEQRLLNDSVIPCCLLDLFCHDTTTDLRVNRISFIYFKCIINHYLVIIF